MTPLVPLEGHGPDGWEGSFSVLPLVGSFLLLTMLVVVLAAWYLSHQGKLTLPKIGSRRSPEDEAKAILAERFARGDIGSEEFMERSSVLNWTPGSDSLPSRHPKKRRRF